MNEQVLNSHRYLVPFVVTLVCVAGILRTSLLAWPRYAERVPKPHLIWAISQALVTDSSKLNELLSAAGVDRVDQQRFDESAAVILACGVDSEPGQAGLDDNFDGIVDNSPELGAVGSDDQCVAPWETEYATARQQQGTSTISKGAFVSSRGGQVAGTDASRYVLAGRSGDAAWTWLVIP